MIRYTVLSCNKVNGTHFSGGCRSYIGFFCLPKKLSWVQSYTSLTSIDKLSCKNTIMQFDEVLKDVGGFGPFQWRIWLGTCLVFFCGVMFNLAQVFLGGESDHWCLAPELDAFNCTRWSLDEAQCTETTKSIAIPLSKDSNLKYEYENCVRYNLTGVNLEDWYPGWNITDYTNVTMECDSGWVYDTTQFKTTIISEVSFNTTHGKKYSTAFPCRLTYKMYFYYYWINDI